MASLFQDATRALVRQLDPVGDLIPLNCIIDAACFQPFCLVRKKRKGTLFWGTQYVKTHFSLRDMLEPGTKLPEPRKDCKISIQGCSDGGVTASVKPEALGLPVNLSVTVGGKRQNILDIQKLSIVNDLENLKKRKLRKPELSFLQKLRELGENLYMVTEAVETLKEATLEKGSKAEGGVSITLLTAVGLKGSLNFNNTINLPLGTILAFRLKQLIIGENSWGMLMRERNPAEIRAVGLFLYCAADDSPKSADIPPFKDKKLKTFPVKDNEMTPRTLYRPEPATREHTGFRALQAEVEDELQALENLTSLRRSALLAELLALLGQAKELQKLEKAVDGALDLDQPVTPGILGGPGDAVLKWLQETSGKLNPMLAGNILYLLGALQEMSEEQQQLLAMSVEKEILPRQMKLMETILDQNFLREEVGPFRLHCELLGGFKGEELKVTQALVGLCNLDIQGDGPLYTWEPNALRPLCALYAALSIFRVLADNTWLSRHLVHQGFPSLTRPGLGKAEWGLGMDPGDRSFHSKLPLEMELQRLHMEPSIFNKDLEGLFHREGKERLSYTSQEVAGSSSAHSSHISRDSGKAGVQQGSGLQASASADRGSFSGVRLGAGSSFAHTGLIGRGMSSAGLGAIRADMLKFDTEFDAIRAEHQRLLNQEFGDVLGPKTDLEIWRETSKFSRI